MPSFDLGEFTIGGFPDSISGSTADPLVGLLSDPSAEREFLLRGKPARAEPFSLAFTTSPASYVNLGNILNLILNANFTMEVLFWGTQVTGSIMTFASKRSAAGAANVGWLFYLDGSNNLVFSCGDGTAQYLVTVAGAQWMDGLVHRASVVVDRTSAFNMSLFVDGSLVAVSTSIAAMGSLTNALDFRIGSLSGGASNYVGNLADFRMWPTARSAEQIDTFKFAQLAPADYPPFVPFNISVYMKLNEGTGASAYNIALGGVGTAYPITNATWSNVAAKVMVDLSTSGYLSRSTDSPYKLFPGAIARPYNFSVNLPLPDLIGGASLGVGDLVIDNPDGLRDADALYDWLGADADMYIGRRGDALASFTRFSRGKAAGITKNLDSWSVLYRDLRFKLQKRLQQHRYGGFGSAVRLDGVDDWLTTGASTIASTASATWECYFRCAGVNAAATAQTIIGHGTIFNTVGLDFYVQIENAVGQLQLFIYRAQGGAGVNIVHAGYDYRDGLRHHLAVVLAAGTGGCKLYVDGVLIGTATQTGFTSVNGILFLGRALDVAANYFKGDVDEIRGWNVARAREQIISAKGAPLSGAETGLIYYNQMNEGTGTVATPSVGSAVLTLTLGPVWVGSLEGGAALAGKPKPLVFGKRRQIPLTLVDDQRLVYQAHDGSMAGVDAVRIAGDPVLGMTFGSNLTDIYSAAPAAGQFNTCLVMGLIRIGTAPGAAAVTADVRGDNAAPLGYQDTAGGVHRKITTQYGGLADPADLDTASYTALAAKTTAVIGLYFADEINVDAAMDDAIKSINGWWAPSRIAQSVVGRVEPPEGQTASVSVTTTDIVDAGYSDEPVGVGRVGQVVLGYRPYTAVLSPDQIAGAVPLVNRDDFGRDYRTVTATDPARTADADTLVVKTNIDDPVAAQAEADRLLALWKVNRTIYKRQLDTGLLSYFIGTVFNVTTDRYDTKYGKNMVAVGVAEDIGEHASSDSIAVVLFG